MAFDVPPTTVSQLLAKVTTSTGNIAKHRAAMSEVAAQAKVTPPPQPEGEVSKP